MKKMGVTLFLFLGIIVLIASPCLAAEGKAAAPAKTVKGMAVKAPLVKLERIEVASYWGYKPEGSPLALAFIYSIHNPGYKNVKLNEIRFTVFFEDIEVKTLTYFEENYIPSKTTDLFRVTGAFY